MSKNRQKQSPRCNFLAPYEGNCHAVSTAPSARSRLPVRISPQSAAAFTTQAGSHEHAIASIQSGPFPWRTEYWSPKSSIATRRVQSRSSTPTPVASRVGLSLMEPGSSPAPMPVSLWAGMRTKTNEEEPVTRSASRAVWERNQSIRRSIPK